MQIAISELSWFSNTVHSPMSSSLLKSSGSVLWSSIARFWTLTPFRVRSPFTVTYLKESICWYQVLRQRYFKMRKKRKIRLDLVATYVDNYGYCKPLFQQHIHRIVFPQTQPFASRSWIVFAILLHNSDCKHSIFQSCSIDKELKERNRSWKLYLEYNKFLYIPR